MGLILILVLIVIAIITYLYFSKNDNEEANLSKYTTESSINAKRIPKQKLETALDDDFVWDNENWFEVVGTYYNSPIHKPETYERIYVVPYDNPNDSTPALGVFNYLGELLGHIAKSEKSIFNLEKEYFVNNIFVRTQTDGKIGSMTIMSRRERKKPKTLEIVTTNEEIGGYNILKSILSSYIDPDRITYKDLKTYFSVLIDNDSRKTICRLYLNDHINKRISFLDENKEWIKNDMQSIGDIYLFSEQLIEATKKFI